MNVWCVWAESGEYENYSNDLIGIFATPDLAEAHAAQARMHYYDEVTVEANEVLDRIPIEQNYYEQSAHILPDGSESTALGYERANKPRYKTFSNAHPPVDEGRIGPWSNKGDDLHVEVTGTDPELVKARYAELLAEAQHQLRSKAQAPSLPPSDSPGYTHNTTSEGTQANQT